MIWLLGGYMWLFIHRPFEIWPWMSNMHIERVYLLATVLYWAFCNEMHWVRNRLNVAFAFFAVVMLASWFVSPYRECGAETVEKWFKVALFYVLMVSSVRNERDLRLLIVLYLGAFALYATHSLREFFCGRHEFRMGTLRMIGVDTSGGDANSFAASILYSLTMVVPIWKSRSRPWHTVLLASYVTLALACLLLTGSRSGFVGFCLLLMILILRSPCYLRWITMVAIAAPILWFSLRADLQNRFLTLIDPSYGPDNARESAYSRLQGLWDGIELWKTYPALGVGPGAFAAGRGYPLQAHNLYGQVIGELGTAGALTLAWIVGEFTVNWWVSRTLSRQNLGHPGSFSSEVAASALIAVMLMLVLGIGAHNLYRYNWLWFGAFGAMAANCEQQAAAMPGGAEFGLEDERAYATVGQGPQALV